MLRIRREHKAFKMITAGSLAFTIGIVASGVYAVGNLRYQDLTFNSERQVSSQASEAATPVSNQTTQDTSGSQSSGAGTSTGLSVSSGATPRQSGSTSSTNNVQPASPMPTPSTPVVDEPIAPTSPVEETPQPSVPQQPVVCDTGLILIDGVCTLVDGIVDGILP